MAIWRHPGTLIRPLERPLEGHFTCKKHWKNNFLCFYLRQEIKIKSFKVRFYVQEWRKQKSRKLKSIVHFPINEFDVQIMTVGGWPFGAILAPL